MMDKDERYETLKALMREAYRDLKDEKSCRSCAYRDVNKGMCKGCHGKNWAWRCDVTLDEVLSEAFKYDYK